MAANREIMDASGAPFVSESELAAPVEAWLRQVGSSCIGREVEVGFGIPDLVAGVGTGRSLKNRRRQAGPITNAIQLAVLEFCKVTRTESELREWAPNGFYELNRRALARLIKDDLLVASAEKFRSRVNPKDPFESLIAVELKLSDVGRGLAQAHAYRAFADVSYLALPAPKVTPPTMARAREIGVGLLAVHRGLVEETVEPDPESFATPGRRRMASEQTLAAHAQGAFRTAGSPRANMMR